MLLPDMKAISLRQGNLSVIMGLADGRIVGGSISGPMIAHGTVKVRLSCRLVLVHQFVLNQGDCCVGGI